MEVGIEDCLHIEFEYNRSKYHLKDVIVGKIYFLLVRIKIKYMEITIAKYEIMDGAPVRGEYRLRHRSAIVKFSVRYYLNLVLVDEEDRRYFKQQVSFENHSEAVISPSVSSLLL
uniref:Uncharacterized protein n=1 Tax=Parascaris equorum TaxID=6256 RepID=A0A914RL44_PAREQ